MKTIWLGAVVCAAALVGWDGHSARALESAAETPAAPNREQVQKLFSDGNFNEAYQGFRRLALDPGSDPKKVGRDLDMALQCLMRLNRINEADALIEAVVEVHQGNWRLLWEAARRYMNLPHQGFMIAGEFHRGHHRGGGKVVNSIERDRVRALQLMEQARPLALNDEQHGEVGEYLLSFAEMLLNQRGWGESWRLQYLTDLTELPDFEDGWGYYRDNPGAPVDADGKPVFHHAPRKFEDSETDGQRWRWCLEQAVEFNPGRKNQVRMHFAEFLWNQFGVQTMAHYGWRFGRLESDDTQEDESGTYALHTLGENETIARLATGVKRFELPDEFNFIKVYQKIIEEPQTGHDVGALAKLAEIHENRRQYPKAAEYWRQVIKKDARQQYKQRLSQIVENWGRFEPAATQPAGRGATIEYRFRNGHTIELTAHEINVEKLLDDVKAYLKSNPGQLDWEKANIGDIGHRLVHRNQKQYLGAKAAEWKMVVKPRPQHFDKRVTITTPLQKPGAYLLEAKMQDGNTSFVIIWLNDTSIVRKQLEGKVYYFVADAASGAPVAKANLEFFGYRQEYVQPRSYRVSVKQFAEFADADGQLTLGPDRQPGEYQWIVIARGDKDRFAYLGFSNVWYGQRHDPEYHETKVFPITDRPVYRPEQTVQYKFWVRHAKYDQEDTSDYAGRTFTVTVRNPKGEELKTEQLKADEYGGIAGEYPLPADAMLGVWNVQVIGDAIEAAAGGAPAGVGAGLLESVKRAVVRRHHGVLGGVTFRVEEYKKPEFEVTVEAPTEPVMLGEKITATIHAKYYFGSPVTKAKVKYKVLRTSHTERWYPIAPWDWLYGRGYWWYAYDYTWYPGWREWGCPRPWPFWWPRGQEPPELVADQEVEIGPDGTVKVEIDTEVAKAVHPNQDHRYEITAEVTDESRRTIVGSGRVLVARKPFKVYAWVDRGYYRIGDVIHAHFSAQTLDNKPVEGKGRLALLRITYEKGKPVETPVQTWDLDTGVEGTARQQIRASQSGQYRLSYTLTDAKEHRIEGGYLFTIIGEGFDSAQFRFNAVELIPDKADYAPGEKVRLQINTDRAGGTVLLFVRPTNGIYLPPKVIRLTGKSVVEEIEVTKRDMPNFFVEAVVVADGRVYTEVKEIVVPPEKRVLAVDVEPSKEAYKPGEKAKVTLKLTDFTGEPFVGSTVVAIYDKSVEYISGGTNVPEIKEFFWKWRRHHHPQGENNLSWWFHNIVPPKQSGMGDLGVFGASVAEEMDELEDTMADGADAVAMGGGFGGRPAFRAGGFGLASPQMGGFMPMEAPGAAMPLMDHGDAMAPSAPMEAGMEMADAAKGGDPGAPPGAAMVEPTVRTQFADTALWVAAIETAKDGTAEVELDMPENLTTWRIKVWGMGHGTKVGEGATDVVTRKDLIIRLQAPRFFVQKDEVVLSANVHNYLKAKKSVQVELGLGGDTLELIETATLSQTVEIEPNGEARVDWRVRVLDEGQATITMKALTDEESDAMEMTFPCYIHGMLKMEAYSGVIRPEDTSGKFTVNVPAERRPKQTRLEVRYSPTLAGAMVDALPYLVDYPYGCTEQTLNRFLPTVITQKILIDMGLDLEDIKEKRVNLNPQELGEAAERAKQWQRYARNPVFDEEEVRKMVKDGVERLTQMQLSDGGWGWFSGWGERSSAHTTALVVHGLQVARDNDVALVPGMLERGVEWLKRYQAEEVRKLKNALQEPKVRPWKSSADNLDAFVYMVLLDADVSSHDMKEFLYRDRLKLSVYAMAMFGLALEKQGDKEKLDMILRNIAQYVRQDDENQTAWLLLPEGIWWYWYGSEYEAMAYYLKLLSKTDPKGELAPRLVKYLLNNRKHATYWNSTRDTALCVEAMADFLRASGESKPEMTVEVWFNGELQKAVEVTPQTLFTFDNSFVAEGEGVAPGAHEVELRKKGQGPLYYNGYMTNFTLEDFITKAGLEIKVERKYYKLVPRDKTVPVAGARGQVVGRKVEAYDRQEVPNDAVLKSGDLVEIELVIESKNDYEYLVFEDMKPAGFEPVDLRSGYTGNEMGAYVEYRDNRVVMFVNRLARGKHSVSYRMRAEIPGRFSALPTRTWAMYAPELKANSDELKLRVED
jgi:alpha-2-macroglobulin